MDCKPAVVAHGLASGEVLLEGASALSCTTYAYAGTAEHVLNINNSLHGCRL